MIFLIINFIYKMNESLKVAIRIKPSKESSFTVSENKIICNKTN